MKKTLFALALLGVSTLLNAQSKVFKEVYRDISSEIRFIHQENELIGYLAFTVLEKADEDSFNYRITIMDENLNDIGTVNFRERRIRLKGVAFEQDMLMLAYFKKDQLETKPGSRKSSPIVSNDDNGCIFMQFLNLEGKIVRTRHIQLKEAYVNPYYSPFSSASISIDAIQAKNVPGTGFALYYPNNAFNRISIYTPDGKDIWHSDVTRYRFATLMTGNDAVYILGKTEDPPTPDGGFEMAIFTIKDSTVQMPYTIADKKGNDMRVLNFDIDPATKQPFIAGYIIEKEKTKFYDYRIAMISGMYKGLFNVHFASPQRNDYQETYSYWADDTHTPTSVREHFKIDKSFVHFRESFRDFEGNTVFIGCSLEVGGAKRPKYKSTVMVTQSPGGRIDIASVLPGKPSRFYPNHSYYTVYDNTNKKSLLILEDQTQVVIFDVEKEEIVRTIPRNDGNIRISVYPAKPGHVMIAEYNEKEKYTRISIESL